MKRSLSSFEIQAARRVDRFCHPVKRHIREQLVPCKTLFEITVAIGPIAKFFENPGSQRSRRVIQSVSQCQRRGELKMRICAPALFPLLLIALELEFLGRQLSVG